jgi:hypothetical protein
MKGHSMDFARNKAGQRKSAIVNEFEPRYSGISTGNRDVQGFYLEKNGYILDNNILIEKNGISSR